MNKLFLAFCLTLTLAASFGQSPAFFHDLRDGSNSLMILDIIPFENRYLVARSLGNHMVISIHTHEGQKLSEYNNTSYGATNISVKDSKFFIFARKYNTTHPDSIRLLVLDSNLNLLSNSYPIKKNWPRAFFANRSFIESRINNQIAYFGPFTDSNFNDSTPLSGWLTWSHVGDTLQALGLNTTFSATRMLYCFPSDTGFFSLDPITRVIYPWSANTPVSSISKFNSRMQWQNTSNFAMASNLPGYPRLIESSGSFDLAINNQSIYAVAEYEAASSNLLNLTQKSCAVYQFNHELNRLRVVHDTAAAGKMVETGSTNGATKQITFDRSGQFIYVLWKECDAFQFVDQTRECATIVLKYDTALNLVWKRKFAIPDMYFHGEGMAPTPDGGVLVVGFYIDLPPAPDVKSVFVIKVDSAGNHVVSVPGVSAIDNKITAYPNPTSDVLNLSWLSGHYNQLLLRDVQGRLIHQEALDPQATSTQVDVQNWAAGLYFYQLRSPNGQQLQGKFLKR